MRMAVLFALLFPAVVFSAPISSYSFATPYVDYCSTQVTDEKATCLTGLSIKIQEQLDLLHKKIRQGLSSSPSLLNMFDKNYTGRLEQSKVQCRQAGDALLSCEIDRSIDHLKDLQPGFCLPRSEFTASVCQRIENKVVQCCPE